MEQKSIIECQKPKLFLDTHKPKAMNDLTKIKKLLDPKEFPKYQEEIKFSHEEKINIFSVDNNIRKSFKEDSLKFIKDISANDGWLLFVYQDNKELVYKLKENLDFFNRFKEHPYIFGKVKIKEKSYNFENEFDSVFGLLVRKEIYECVGGFSLKFFDFDLAFYDLVRKLSKLFFMIDLSKCGFNAELNIQKNDMDLEFERDFYASLEREPFQASAYDKYILEN